MKRDGHQSQDMAIVDAPSPFGDSNSGGMMFGKS